MDCRNAVENGGWAAFDRDNTTELVTKIPFCDFGEVLDPPSVDVSAHVVEALLKCGYSKDCECVSRGIKFILGEQRTTARGSAAGESTISTALGAR